MAKPTKKLRGIYYDEGKRKWCIQFFEPGTRRRRLVAGDRRTDAITLLARKKAEIAEGRLQPMTRPVPFEQYAETFLKDAELRLRSIATTRIHVAHLKNFFGTRPIQKIITPEVEAYGRARREAGVSGATVNREFATLSRMFSKAELPNPVRRSVFYPEPPHRTRFLGQTEGERERLERAMDPEDWKLVELAIETGMRRAEMFQLAWPLVDLSSGVATVTLSKSGKSRFVHLSDRAVEILQSLRSLGRSDWVFPNEHGTGPLNPNNWINRVFKPALQDAGITDFRLHDCRHTFASRLAVAGVQQRFLQELLGHASPQMTNRYTHLTAHHLRDAVNRPKQPPIR